MDCLPANYPKEAEITITLDNGENMRLCPILPAHRPAMERSFRLLSPESVYFRFFEHLSELPPERLQYLTEIDYDTRFAVVAIPAASDPEEVVAVGRYARTKNPREAELALIVRDDWQHRGIGTRLIQHLACLAAERGVETFLGEVLVENHRAMAFLERLPYPLTKRVESGLYWIRLDVRNGNGRPQ